MNKANKHGSNANKGQPNPPKGFDIMAPDVKKVKIERWKNMEWLLSAACTIIVGVVLIVFTQDRWGLLWPVNMTLEYLSMVLGSLLLVTTLVLIWRYVFAVQGEMRMLRVFLEEFVPAPPPILNMFTVLFSVLLGILAYFSNNILIFTILFVMYNLGDLWGQSMRDKGLREAFHSAKTGSANRNRHNVLRAIELYYLERPQLHRTTSIMFFSFVALILAVLSREESESFMGLWFECGAYVVVEFNIIISEVIIFRWRRARDVVLGEIYSS
ncbi:MAG: hypothetical protein ACYDAA_17635 [Syntrophales bacterium]